MAEAREKRGMIKRSTARAKATWEVGGHDIAVTNLDKPFWPDQGLTKGDLLAYYRDIAPILLPYLEDRPFIMRLWPDGIGGKNFYRWRLPSYAPDWLERFVYQLQTAQRTAEMPVVDDPAELIWVVNQGVIEMHPWVATRHAPDQPTWMFFDLDPVAGVPFERVLEVAAWIGEILEALDLLGLPKTSGGDGVHIFVPLGLGHSFEEVRAWLGSFIEQLDQLHPGAVTSDKRLAAREGKVLIDYSQNAMGKSIVAPYSVRAKPGATVSTPLRWEEVREQKIRPSDFTVQTVRDRLAQQGDLFAALRDHPQQLLTLPEERTAKA
jgi:bifunctional non-homologous end joining protein LigD